MSDRDNFEPYGTSIFCEDIRQEVSGTMTLVGVFAHELVVPNLPVFLPKLSALTTLIIPKVEEPSIQVVLNIFMPGENPLKPTFHLDQTLFAMNSAGDAGIDPDIVNHSKVVQRFTISPVEIKASGFIRIRAIIAGHFIKAGVLRIVVPATQLVASSH